MTETDENGKNLLLKIKKLSDFIESEINENKNL